jgi:hypothetical protein
MNVLVEETKKFKESDMNKDDLFKVDLKVEKEDVFKKDFYMNSKKKLRYGKTYTFCFDQFGIPSIVIGPHCI